MKLIALVTGDDDSVSCEHLLIPDDMDLSKMKKEHDEWYKNIYKLDLSSTFYTLSGWLIKNGAKIVPEDVILEVNEFDL